MQSTMAYAALDAASAFLTFCIAAGFLWLASRSRRGLHVLVGLGFALVAAGFLFVSASHFGGGSNPDSLDLARIAGNLGGALLLLFAYATSRLTGRAYAVLVGYAWGGAVVILATGLWLLPPTAQWAPLPQTLGVAYALAATAYLACAILSGYGWHRRPSWSRALVPLGFLCWTFSMYTWIFIALEGATHILPVVYAWRVLAIALILGAMLHRPRLPGGDVHAAP